MNTQKDFFNFRQDHTVELTEGKILDKLKSVVKSLLSKMSIFPKKRDSLEQEQLKLEKEYDEIDYENLSPEQAEKKEQDIESKIQKIQLKVDNTFDDEDKANDKLYTVYDKLDAAEIEEELEEV